MLQDKAASLHPIGRGAERRAVCWVPALALLCAAAVSAQAPKAPPTPVRITVEPFASPLRSDNLADFGVADIDRDGRLDLFTSNHNMRAQLYVASDDRGFVDALSRLGLDADPELPGIEASLAAPDTTPAGLHVYFDEERLRVRATAAPGEAPPSFAGVLHFAKPVQFESEGGVRIGGGARPKAVAELAFETEGEGLLTIEPWFPKHEIELRLDAGTPLDRVFLGQQGRSPTAREVLLRQVDRHGLAWADYDGDEDLDVFISRGAMVGMAPATLGDELFRNSEGRYHNVFDRSGIRKRRGRARRVEWVDFDLDGRLDLYVGNTDSPNRLWRQNEDGTFSDVTEQHQLGLRQGEVFRWFDVDSDGDPDLLAAIPGYASLLFVNEGGRFTKRALESCPTNNPSHLALADFDGDGDVDVFVADAQTNRLFVADADGFTGTEAIKVGLPGRSATANWVDFDNDGLLDIHLVPGGVRRQVPGGRFLFAGNLVEGRPRLARCAWIDLDDDGDRDPLCEVSREGLVVEHSAATNQSGSGHWLQIDLVGKRGNRQAIGASLLIEQGERRVRHVVGEAEGAHWSQGHYRIYAGLGAHPEPVALTIRWPGGSKRRIESVAPDQRIEVKYDVE